MDQPPVKRRRTSSSGSLPTPPVSDCDIESTSLLERATHVLSTQAKALTYIDYIYRADPAARRGLANAVNTVVRANRNHGKLVVCGVGKSAYIAMKFAATCKSLGVSASFMHACEAAHGDLGDIRENDVLLFISYSGKTPELLNLLPHLPASTPIMALTSQTVPEYCPLLAHREGGILLPAPVPESEEESFGFSAPTTSTTVALAVADMLALCIAEQIHGGAKKQIFQRNHPGGAIGMNHREVEKLKEDGINVPVVELPSPSISAKDETVN